MLKVLLRLGQSGFYYRGPRYWVRDRERAWNLVTIECAAEIGAEVGFEDAEVVVVFRDGRPDWCLPLHPEPAIPSQESPALVAAAA
jgi:hypothetical protein